LRAAGTQLGDDGAGADEHLEVHEHHLLSAANRTGDTTMHAFESVSRSEREAEGAREERQCEAPERSVAAGARAGAGPGRAAGTAGEGGDGVDPGTTRAAFSLARVPIAPGQRPMGVDPEETEAVDPRVERVTAEMSRAFGLDFSKVRIRHDVKAARIAETRGALALTDGREILFARNAFAPGTPNGDRIIAHEFAHVAQAMGGTKRAGRLRVRGRSVASLGALHFEGARQAASGSSLRDIEEEADRAAEAYLHGGKPEVEAASLGARGARKAASDSSTEGKATKIPPPPVGVWIRVANGETFFYLFNPADLLSKSAQEAARWVYEVYVGQVFGAGRQLADKSADAQGVHFEGGRAPADYGPDEGFWIRINPTLHDATIKYFEAIGIHPKLSPTKVASVYDELGKGSTGGADEGGDDTGAGSEAKPQDAGGDKEPQKEQDSPELKKARDLLQLLRTKYPEMFTAIKAEGLTELDLLKFIAQNPKLFEDLPKMAIGATPTADLSKFKQFLEKWKGAHQNDQGTGDTPGQGGGTNPEGPEVHMLHPDGEIALDPALDASKGDKFITGSTVEARVQWKGEALGWMDAFPHWGEFDWRLVDTLKNSVVDRPYHIGLGVGDDSWSVDVPKAGGTYQLLVTIQSSHFYGFSFTPKPVLMPTVSEATRDKDVFNTSFVGDDDKFPFERDERGKLHLKGGQQALSLDDEVTSLDTQIGAIHALEGKGQLTAENAKNYAEYFENEKKALEELKTKTDAAKGTYFVRMTFVSRENSSTIPQMRVYMVELDDSVALNDEQGTVNFKVILYDTTLNQENYTQHPGEGSAPIRKDQEPRAHQQAELDAVKDMAEHFHSHNDYPKGTIHMAVKLLLTNGVFEDTRNTNNWKKPAEAALGYIGMAAGVALILASPLDFGATAVAGIALIGAASGLISAGLALEEQFAKEGRIKVDSRLALNLVTIATSLVGLSEIRGAFTAVRQLSRGVMFAKIGFNLGATGVQAVVVYQQVQDELNALEAQYKPRLLSMDPNSAEYKTLEREYKSKVAQIMGSAAANGTFMLVAFGQGVHGLAELPAPGMMSGKNFSVHEDVIDLVQQFSETRDPRLIEDRIKSGIATPDELNYLKEALGKIPAKNAKELPATPEPLKPTQPPAEATAGTGGATTAKSEPAAAPPKKPSQPSDQFANKPADLPVDQPTHKPATTQPPAEKTTAPPEPKPAAPPAETPRGPAVEDPAAGHADAQKKADQLAPEAEATPESKATDPGKEAHETKEPTPAPQQQAEAPKTETPDERIARQTQAAKEAYRQAKATKYSGKFDSEADFIQLYTDAENPQIFDLKSRHWVSEATEGAPSEKMASTKGLAAEAREDAVDAAMLKFTDIHSESSFKPYYDMLTEEGIATDADVRRELQKLLDGIPKGKEYTVDTIRHNLKAKFRQRIIDRMFVDAQGHELTSQESHAAMRRMTKDLNSSDKGNLTESWIDGYRSLDPDSPKGGAAEHVQLPAEGTGPEQGAPQKRPTAKHVEVGKGEAGAAPTSDRVVDRVEFDRHNLGTINEIKSGEGKLNKHDMDQHADNMAMVNKESGTSVNIEDQPVVLKKVKLTFTSPEGASANANWIIDELSASDNLSVEVFNKAGGREVFTQETVGKDGSALLKFLGTAK
jgi:hypothetical protein